MPRSQCFVDLHNFIVGKKSGRYTYAQRTDFTETVQAMTLRKQVSASSSRTKVHMLTDEERVQELDRVIQHITDVYMEQPNNKTEFMEELKQREDKFMVCELIAIAKNTTATINYIIIIYI